MSKQQLRSQEDGDLPTSDSTDQPVVIGDQLSNVLVGIPAYNEEVGIGSIVLKAKKYTQNVLVVDDGSSDSTVEIAERAGATVLQHDENQGKGAAVRTIFEQAATEEYDALVILDGDGQHMPEDIPKVVEPILADTCDMSIGSRYLEEEQTETPLYRRFGQKVLDYATVGSSGTSVSDSQSGFRGFSMGAVDQLSIGTDGIGVESELISDASEQGLTIEEVPIDVKYDNIDGQTYNPLHHGLAVLMFVLQLVRDRHPLLFFGVPGVVLLLFGGGLGLHSAIAYESTGVLYQWRAIISGFAIVTGILCVFSALVLHQISNLIKND